MAALALNHDTVSSGRRPATAQSTAIEEAPDGVASNDDPSDPRAFLLEMRRRALTRKGLRAQREERTTLEHLIRTTRAILATNGEIWERCKPFCCGKVVEDTTSTTASTPSSRRSSSTILQQRQQQHPPASKASPRLLFCRLAHSTVKANTYDGLLSMESALEVTKRSFHLPMAIPYPLNRMIALPRQPKDDIMPNFDLMLKRAMLLSEDILVLYLMEFKDFLEKLQVALGEVDSWLLETEKCKAFLKEYFGKDGDFFEIDDDVYDESSDCDFEERYSLDKFKKTKCSRCEFLCSQHAIDKSSSSAGSCYWTNCPSACRNNKKDQSGYFPVSLERTLMLCRLKGSIKMNFCIDEEEDRQRLIKFLSFATGASQARNQDDEDGH